MTHNYYTPFDRAGLLTVTISTSRHSPAKRALLATLAGADFSILPLLEHEAGHGGRPIYSPTRRWRRV